MEADPPPDTKYPSSGSKNPCGTHVRAHLGLYLTLVGVVLGFAAGFALRLVNLTNDHIEWIGI